MRDRRRCPGADGGLSAGAEGRGGDGDREGGGTGRAGRRVRKELAADWIRRWMGDEVYQMQWQPLLRGKFHQYYPEIALPWFWSRVKCRTTHLGYMKGGFQHIYNALGEKIRAAGGEMRL